MELKKIINLQKEFDKTHRIRFDWDENVSEKNLSMLEYLSLSLAGEVGELANYVKKVMRGDASYEASKEHITEEIVDAFIYILKFSYQMGFDLEENYLKKLEINKLRFKTFEK